MFVCDTVVQAGLGVVWWLSASHLLPVLCVFVNGGGIRGTAVEQLSVLIKENE